MANHPEMVVIILTDYDIPKYRNAASQCGGKYFFAKESLDWGAGRYSDQIPYNSEGCPILIPSL